MEEISWRDLQFDLLNIFTDIHFVCHVQAFDIGGGVISVAISTLLILAVAVVLLFLLPVSNTGLFLKLQGFDLTELPRFGFSR